MLICIIGDRDKLEEFYYKLAKATPKATSEHIGKCQRGLGSITLVSLGDEVRIQYMGCMGFEDMKGYEKRYWLSNIHHVSAFLRKTKEVHDKLK